LPGILAGIFSVVTVRSDATLVDGEFLAGVYCASADEFNTLGLNIMPGDIVFFDAGKLYF
jgi:hypothetical protein